MIAVRIDREPGAETCGMRRPADTPSCGKPAAWRVSSMCVHEHDLSDCFLCAECAETARRPWRCTPCRDGEQGHACFVSLHFERTGVLA
jgi:hypothetical protein